MKVNWLLPVSFVAYSCIGRTHDSGMLRQSRLLEALDASLPEDMAATLYGDAGYPEAPRLRHQLKRNTGVHTDTEVKVYHRRAIGELIDI